MLDRTEPATHQMVARARRRVEAGRPRRAVGREEHLRVLERFLAASRDGDVDALVDVLAEDAVLVSDGGAHRHAVRRPVVGRDRVAAFLRSIGPRALRGAVEVVDVNGEPGFVVVVDGVVAIVGSVEVSDGRVVAVRWVLNPDKLHWVVPGAPPVGP